jgi:hypothetical protein
MTIANSSSSEFPDIIKRLRDRLDQLSESLPEFTDDYHRLFLYFAGETFEEVSPDRIKICDRKGDQKLDFYNAEEDRFVAYQCKLPELDLLEGNAAAPSYGAELVNEVEDILTFLADTSGLAKGNRQSQEARNRYRSMKRTADEAGGRYQLEVVLAFFGKLTAPAEERLEELRANWSNENEDFKITVKDYDDIARELNLSLLSRERPKEIRITFKIGTVVHTDQWVTVWSLL